MVFSCFFKAKSCLDSSFSYTEVAKPAVELALKILRLMATNSRMPPESPFADKINEFIEKVYSKSLATYKLVAVSY